MHLAQELLMNVQCSGGSRSFAKETSALKMRSAVASHQKLTKTSEGHLRSWSSYNDTRSYWRTQRWPFYGHLAFEANWKDEKAWQVSGLRRWSQIKKKSSFWNVFSYSKQQRTISWLDCDMGQKVDFMWQLVTTSVVGLIWSSKALPKAKCPPKKCHGHCWVVRCPSDPLQFSESWQNHYFDI